MTSKIAIGVALAGAVAFGVIITSLSQAKDDTSKFSDAQQAAIKELIADYIAENPQALVEALNSYAEEERRRAEMDVRDAARANIPMLLSDNSGYTTGKDPANAEVAIIEFYDYHCGFCKRATGLVQDLTNSDPDVKVVFRELPILREESETAARYAIAAKEQNKFLDLHFAMMEARGVLNEDRILDIAKDNGLDLEKLRKSASSPQVRSEVAKNRDFARQMGVDGTPTFMIASLNGDFVEVIPGFSPEGVEAAIAEAKRANKAN